MKRPAALALCLCAAAIALGATPVLHASAALAQAAGPAPAADPGKAVYDQSCTPCHDTSAVDMAHRSAAQWKDTVDQMRALGAAVDDAQETMIVAYLAKTHPA